MAPREPGTISVPFSQLQKLLEANEALQYENRRLEARAKRNASYAEMFRNFAIILASGLQRADHPVARSTLDRFEKISNGLGMADEFEEVMEKAGAERSGSCDSPLSEGEMALVREVHEAVRRCESEGAEFVLSEEKRAAVQALKAKIERVEESRIGDAVE